LGFPERPLQPLEGTAVVVVAVDVAQQPRQARGHRLVRVLDGGLDAVAYPCGQPFDVAPLARHPDHRDGEQPAAHQVIEGRVDLLEAQVAGRAEQHEGIAVTTFHVILLALQSRARRARLTASARCGRRIPGAWPTAPCWRTRRGRATRSARTAPPTARAPVRPLRSPPAPSSAPRPNPPRALRRSRGGRPWRARPRSDRAGARR